MNSFLSNFPLSRPRRLRKEPWIRQLIQETYLNTSDLIYPIFITYNKKSSAIDSMPGIKRLNIDEAVVCANKAYELGIKAVALFPEVPEDLKNDQGTEALNEENIICKTVKKIKENIKGLGVICDVALDPYTTSGHDGIVINNKIDNDKTVEILCKQALVNANAGCDIIAPSDMMDGRIKVIRKYLDQYSFQDILIMSYAAKYASSYYGPFRNAISASSRLGKDKKKTYQMDYNNTNEALKEVSLDIKEGADIILVKPGMPYLDVLSSIKKSFKLPTFSYQVSGEYSMLKKAVNDKVFKSEEVIIETLSCFKRAGADAIITYFALEAATLLNNK